MSSMLFCFGSLIVLERNKRFQCGFNLHKVTYRLSLLLDYLEMGHGSQLLLSSHCDWTAPRQNGGEKNTNRHHATAATRVVSWVQEKVMPLRASAPFKYGGREARAFSAFQGPRGAAPPLPVKNITAERRLAFYYFQSRYGRQPGGSCRSAGRPTGGS